MFDSDDESGSAYLSTDAEGADAVLAHADELQDSHSGGETTLETANDGEQAAEATDDGENGSEGDLPSGSRPADSDPV